ncbi:MAG: LegC family aminotransferase [Sandarakinorhabdus sp.]|nr:LegC family aminotransferase [Sandarakinorhabdus sp.]
MTEAALVTPTGDVAADIVGAVRGVLGPADTMIALHEPEFAGNEARYVADCIETGWVSSVGSYVDRFERDLAAFTGSAHAVATMNGTAALHVCLLLAGVRPGDEVLVPALTFIATANAVSYANAVPHFVDAEARSLGVDPARLELYLRDIADVIDGVTVNRATGAPIRALLVMHVFGHPCDLDALDALARRWHLVLVEDAAESLGSSYHGRHTGNVGRLASLSFNGNKVVTTGGGGAVLTNDPVLGARAKHLTTTARVRHRWDFVHDEIGFNYRLPNLNAALGCAQLERLPDMLARKRRLAAQYEAAFAPLAGVEFVREPTGTTGNYWLNAIVLDAALAERRDDVLTALNDAGYMSRPLWMPMHRLPMYAGCPRDALAVTEQLSATLINLPSSPKLAAP